MINDYKLFHYYTYTDNLYAYIEKLPNKYPTIFSQIYPNIVNFLKIQNCQNLQSAEKLIEEEENQVNKYLNEFYENNELKYFYINQIIRLLGKKIKVSDYKDLFLNIPFEIVDFHIIDIKSSNIEIILEIKSPTTLKLLKKIADETIFQVIKYELFSKLNNFIKGGLIEHALIKLIREGNSIFGKFKNIFDIDCFLNKFKSGYNEKIPSERIEKLKNFKKLKMNYFNKEYKGESTLLIPTNSNSKDWDLAFINKNDEDDIGLCISQISINKSIKKIQNMLNNFSNKKNFIKKKIEKIYGIEISYTYILFILSKKYQNKETLNFLNKYNIPFILFVHDNDIKFLTNKLKPIDKFELTESYSYLKIKKNLINCLDYSNNEIENEIDEDSEGDNNNEIKEEDIESEDDSNQENIDIGDIINNKNLNELI